MADYLVTDTELTNVANAIRTKGGTSVALTWPTGYVNAIDDIETGGVSNYVTGTFTTGASAGRQDVSIPYTGNGYPIIATITVKGGWRKTPWWTKVEQYCVGEYTMQKSVYTSTPTYTTSGGGNMGDVLYIYKTSATSGTAVSIGGSAAQNIFSGANADSGTQKIMQFKNATTMSIYHGVNLTSFSNGTEYEYHIVYSE